MMYWSVIGDHSHLEESAMDGSLRRVILEKNLRRPTGQYVCSQTGFDLFQRGGGVGKKKILKTDTIGFEIKLKCLDHNCVVYEFAISEDELVLRCRKKLDYAKDIKKKNPKIQKPAYLALCLKSPSKNILNHQMKLILPLI